MLRNIDLSVPAGGSLAIVGPSGSGKSTLLQLLMGHHRGYEGSISIDGTELRDISPASLYELLSVIQQEVFIFNSSIEKNVTMFGDFAPERVEAALEGAGLSALISERGLDFVCGENGQNLSGGERQRVSIARSLLKNARPARRRGHGRARQAHGHRGHVRCAGYPRHRQDSRHA